MKIAVIPDIHLNKTVYKGVMDRNIPMLPFRNVDFMNAFEHAVNQCISELHPDLVVIPGDVYDNFEPSNEVRGFFSGQLSKLSNAKIPVIILIGNHDVCKKHHGLKDIQELKLKNIVVIEKPTITAYKDMQLFLFPYSLEVEQQKKTIKEDFLDFVREIKSKKTDAPNIFFGHFGVRGAALNEYTDEETTTDTTTTEMPVVAKSTVKEFKNRNPNDIGTDDLDSIGADYVILGDYHKHQVLNIKKCIAMYPGSLEKTSFSEKDQSKGFVWFDSEAALNGNMGKCRFIEYPKCRPMLELKGNFIEIKDKFKNTDYSKYKDAIVKITFTGTGTELIDISTNLESFKKEIRDILDPIHIDFINKSTNNEQVQAANSLEKEIMEKGHLSNDDVIGVVKEIVKERITDEKELALIIDLADEVYKETAGK